VQAVGAQRLAENAGVPSRVGLWRADKKKDMLNLWRKQLKSGKFN
jgi:hypothetical protein